MTEPMGPSAEERTPPPPEALLEWTRRFAGGETLSGGATLLEGAGVALNEALSRPGRNRDGAYALLVSDALLTWASEDAANGTDPAGALGQAMEAVTELVGDPDSLGGGGAG